MDVIKPGDDIKPGDSVCLGNNTIHLTYVVVQVRVSSSKPVGKGSLDDLKDQVSHNWRHDVGLLYSSKREKEGDCASYTKDSHEKD